MDGPQLRPSTATPQTPAGEILPSGPEAPLTGSKVTVLPVSTRRRARPDEPDPGALVAENERLRAENAVLRERLANVQAIALEREQRIEDLKHALRMLPSVWARKLEGRLGSGTDAQEMPASEEAPAAEPAVAEPAAAECAAAKAAVGQPAQAQGAGAEPTTAEPTTAEPEVHAERAEAILAEVAALRSRLERKRLDIERHMLEQERRKLQADLAWTRKWRRFRKPRLAGP